MKQMLFDFEMSARVKEKEIQRLKLIFYGMSPEMAAKRSDKAAIIERRRKVVNKNSW